MMLRIKVLFNKKNGIKTICQNHQRFFGFWHRKFNLIEVQMLICWNAMFLQNNSTSVLSLQETQLFESDISNSPNRTRQRSSKRTQKSEPSAPRMDVEQCMKEIERLRLQRKLELQELMKLRESVFNRVSTSSPGANHDEPSLTPTSNQCSLWAYNSVLFK